MYDSEEAEEGWETVQRTNKTKSRPSPTNGFVTKTTVSAKQADRRTVAQTRHKEGNIRATVTASRQIDMNTADDRKELSCMSAIDVSKLPSQQQKISSHVSNSRANRGSKSSPRVARLPAGPPSSCSETQLKTADNSAADVMKATDSQAAGEHSSKLLGEARLNSSSFDDALCETRLSTGIDDALSGDKAECQLVTVSRAGGSVTSVGSSDVVSCRTWSSMTEVCCSDIQRSSSDSDQQLFHLCHKSVSDDTLVACMTTSGDVILSA